MKRLNLNLLTILAVVLSLSVMTTSCSDDDEGGTAAIEDLDGDGIADSEDDDIDGDGVPNEDDQDPTNPDVGAGDDDTDPVSGFASDADAWTTSVEEGQQTVGADVSVFGWSYTASQIAGDIDGLNDENVTTEIANTQEADTISGSITADETWTNDRFWKLNGKVYVEDGATLTINPGTIVKGLPSSGDNASALVVAQGGKLIADGTAEQPIIFTAEEDDIALGETVGTNLTVDDRQKWGGVLVLGKAPGSFSGDVTEIQVEGIPSDEPGLYGGDDPADNSGILNYVSIRHGGAVIGADNEINGLTLGGVGTGTTVSNIEVVANLDDGVEWFGGTVDSSNIIVWGVGDDALDLDEAYSGTVSNAATIQENVSDHAFEIDGPAGSTQDSFTIENVTMFGDSSSESGTTTGNREYVDLRDGARCTLRNIYAFGFLPGSDVELDDDDSANNYKDGNITFENWEIAYPEGDDNSVMWNNTTDVTIE